MDQGTAAGDSPVLYASIGSWAPGYLDRGWALIPLNHMNGPRCSCPAGGDEEHSYKQGGKHPLWREWQHHGIRTFDQAKAVWAQAPHANVGIVTGDYSGVFVLDMDPDNGGLESLDAMEAKYGKLPATFTVRTGSGGLHFYFAMPGFNLVNSGGLTRAGYHGLDIRGNGGQVAAPPSVSGKGAYRIELPADVVPAPEWLLDLLRPGVPEHPTATPAGAGLTPSGDVIESTRITRYVEVVLDTELANLGAAIEGERNSMAFRVACRFWELINATWIDHDWLHSQYHQACERNGLPWTEAQTVWNKGRAQVKGAAAVLPPAEHVEGGGLTYAELGGVPPFSPPGYTGYDATPVTAATGYSDSPVSPGDQLAPFTGVQTTPVYDHTGYAGAPVSPFELAVTRELARMRAQAEARRRMVIEVAMSRSGGMAVLDAQGLIDAMLDTETIGAVPPLVPLVDELLMMNTLARVIGPSGHAKSFLTLDLAACVEIGRAHV